MRRRVRGRPPARALTGDTSPALAPARPLVRFMRDARLRGRVTVKDRVGRVRYVAFRVVGDAVSRAALGGALPQGAKLTRFDGVYGILRVGHRDRDVVVAVLKEARRVGDKEVRVETLATSGTIRQAATALPPSSPASRRTTKRD